MAGAVHRRCRRVVQYRCLEEPSARSALGVGIVLRLSALGGEVVVGGVEHFNLGPKLLAYPAIIASTVNHKVQPCTFKLNSSLRVLGATAAALDDDEPAAMPSPKLLEIKAGSGYGSSDRAGGGGVVVLVPGQGMPASA